MRIAVIGTGGVGGYLGARLWKAGNQVTFIARGNHLSQMRKHGLLLNSDEGNIRAQADFSDTLTGQEPCDLAIVAVKSFDTMEACKLIRPALRPGSIVLSFQNGIENEYRLGQMLGAEHILGGVAYIFSTISAPGVIQHSGGTGIFKFGEMDGTLSKRGRKLEQVFQAAGIRATTIEHFPKMLWEKWIFICGLGGMTAWARCTIGEILSRPLERGMLEDIVHEAAEIGRARGIDPFPDLETRSMAHFSRLPQESTSSMYYDVTHGKRLEVEALNGTVVRIAKELQKPVPTNEMIYRALKPFA